MKILTTFMKQIKAHPITIIFFIIGYFISILILSIGLSNIINMRNNIIEKNNGIYKDSLNVNISTLKDINFEDIVKSFKDISDKSLVRFPNLYTYINDSNDEYEIIAEYFKYNKELDVPLINGRYYTSNEIENSEKVVLLGKNLEKLSYKREGKKKIKLGQDEYTVIGIAGYNKKESVWDESIFMPATSIPENSKLDFIRNRSFSILLVSEDKKESADLKSIMNRWRKIDSNSNINATRTKESENVFLKIIGQNSQFLIIAGVLFIFSIINIVNVSLFWINERKDEIAIRKAFGINNIQICMLLFTEFLSITMVTTILSLISQFVLSLIVETTFGYYLELSKENLILALLMSIVSALITVIIPSVKVMKINPIEALKI